MDPSKSKRPGKNGFVYRQQFGVIVLCKDEHHQASVYGYLKQQGYKLKVVTV